MHKLIMTPVSRRSLLKASAFGAALLALPLWGGRVLAQSSSGSPGKMAEVKAPEGLVSFNAGWAIPLEDKPALLALEEKKIKEAEAAAPKPASPSAPVSADANQAPKSSKSWGDKAQEAWSKVKNFF